VPAAKSKAKELENKIRGKFDCNLRFIKGREGKFIKGEKQKRK
jgi:hypothetical protein